MTRRTFLKTASGLLAASASQAAVAGPGGDDPVAVEAALRQIAQQPVLDLAAVDRPVIVERIELLKNRRHFLVRSRSRDGVEAITVPHQGKIGALASVLLENVVPAFVGQDARRLETLLWDAYRAHSNYKMQGLALGVCFAAVEMNLLELLARSAGKPVADFFGGLRRRDVPVYFASSHRGNAPDAEIDYLRQLVAGSGVRAIKFRVGGRMSRNADSLPGRSETLLRLARDAFGPDVTLYADANGSYDAPEAIRIGRLMQEHGYGFFEEPCEFDDLWATKAVADALDIPVAGGEQESSLHRWRWMIANGGIDVVQPDLHYGGGLVRATQVARMAATVGLRVVPHMSGGGLGHLDVVHFASFTPNAGDFMEFKGNADLPIACATSSLKCENGVVRCPTGVGFGVEFDPAFVADARVITAA